jgi:hypothetical protein
MARQPSLGPSWLVGLLSDWARRELGQMTRGLGYYTSNPMLRDGIPVRATSYEPTGYSDVDVEQVTLAVDELETMQKMSVMRYFKPWTRNAINNEIALPEIMWKHLLDAAMAILDRKLAQPKKLTHPEYVA